MYYSKNEIAEFKKAGSWSYMCDLLLGVIEKNEEEISSLKKTVVKCKVCKRDKNIHF